MKIIPTLRHTIAQWHGNVAWALVSLAFVHALAALFHYYMLRDSVLCRMLPSRAFR
ncbi:cytochrome b561 [Erwinia rhapontici]|nr:cytochrome b561 [Erwinia rhapontici]